jgi:hypothetical protein
MDSRRSRADGNANSDPHKRNNSTFGRPSRKRKYKIVEALSFFRIRQTLEVTPAMELGIPDCVWEIEEIVYPRSPRADLTD